MANEIVPAPADDSLKIGENPIPPLVMQAAQGVGEEAVVIHAFGHEVLAVGWRGPRLLEVFHTICRVDIAHGRRPD